MSRDKRILVIASGNQGKIREFQGLLADLPVTVEAQPDSLDVDETGETFQANARIKAQAVARFTGHWALADDSGLSVTALQGAPGVHSSRYAPTDAERIAKLLAAMDGLQERSAEFRAALCIAAPDGNVLLEVEVAARGKSPKNRVARAVSSMTRSLKSARQEDICGDASGERRNNRPSRSGPSHCSKTPCRT